VRAALALVLIAPSFASAVQAQAPRTPPAVSAPLVTAVEVHLPPGTDVADIPQQIAVARGQPLSLRAVRRSIERLMATGRFADVVVRELPSEGGIRVVFEVSPRQRIATLYIDGENVLTEPQIREASRLSDGGEYYPELVELAEERVRSLYRRRGYDQASVAVELREEQPGAVEVFLTVTEGAPTRVSGVTVGGSPGLPLSRLVTELGLAPGGVLDREELEAGVERLKALYRAERFWSARVGEPEILPAPGGAIVAVPASAGPRYELKFHGNHSFPDKHLAGIVGYDGTETLDVPVMNRMARRLAHFYRYRGFHDVRVTPREVRAPNDARAVIAFDVDEGRPLYVRSVRFDGNRALNDEALARMLAEQIAGMAPVSSGERPSLDDPVQAQGRTGGNWRAIPQPDPTTVYVAEAYEEAARTMRAAYQERGYLSARVSLAEVRVELDARAADVEFQVDEGPRTLVREVRYVGLPAAFDPSRAAEIRVGEPFRVTAVEDTGRSLTRALGRVGYLFARVEGESSIESDGRDARVLFRVAPGPRVRVGKVIVRGLSRTDEEMIRANLVVREGSVLDPEALFESQRNLVLLGIFRNVAVRMISPDTVEDAKDVVVEVRERARVSGELAGGFSLVDGPRVVGEAVIPNLGGVGTSLAGRLKLNYLGASPGVSETTLDPDVWHDGLDFRGNVAVAQPRIYALLPARIGTRLDLIGERVHRPSFNFVRFAAVLGSDWAALPWLNFSLQGEIEYDRVRLSRSVQELLPGLGRIDVERLRFPSGDFTLASVRPTVALDFRDDFARPTRGVIFTSTAEWTHHLRAVLVERGGDRCQLQVPRGQCPIPIYTLKLSGTLTGYIPVAQRVVLALSARGGQIIHLQDGSQTIAPKRFFLGGATSMRGFREDGVVPEDRRALLAGDLLACRALILPSGCTPDAKLLREGREVPSEGGEAFTLIKTELRFPAFAAFDLGVFLEAGNLWRFAENYRLEKLRYVAGAGVRYATPIGPIAFDLGVNLVPDVQINEPGANLHFSIGLF
jgi:outer membrane protein insertion porin family